MGKSPGVAKKDLESIEYKDLFRMLPNSYFIIEAAEPHRFIDANEHHFALTGKTEAIIGQPLFDVYPDVSDKAQKTGKSDLHDSIDKVIRTKKPDTLEAFRYDIPDGKGGYLVRFWHPTHYPLLDGKGRVVAVLQTSKDVTEQTIARHEQEFHKWQIEETLALGLVGTWQWDTESDIVIADKNMARAFGIAADTAGAGIPMQSFLISIHPDDRDRVSAAIQKTLRTRGLFEEEYRTIDADGHMHWVIARGEVQEDAEGRVMLPGVVVEITDRKQREDLLRYQSFITDSIDDAVITLDVKGIVTGWNRAATKLFGHSEKKALGSRSEDVLLINDGYDRQTIRQTAFAGSTWRGKLGYTHADGHAIEVMATVSALRDHGGEAIGIVTVMQDLTEVLKAQNEAEMLKKQNENLLTLNKTKDEFIALTSHQLRTPATGTKQYLGMLLDGYAEPLAPRQRSYLQSAYDCNERQLRVVDDILRVAQVDLDKVVLRKHNTNMCQFVRQIVDDQTSKFARRDHAIEYQLPAHAIMASIDPDRLRMALDNIIDNADKYTEPGKRIEIRLSAGKQYVSIHIQDEGVGIDKSDFAKLFQKFSRIDNPLSIEVGGSGLGLYWSKRIIDMHGGSIAVHSELDKGTTFTVRLPLAAVASSPQKKARTARTTPSPAVGIAPK